MPDEAVPIVPTPFGQADGGSSARATIRRFAPADEDAVVGLIVSIQQYEFAIEIGAEDQPDLRSIGTYYQTGAGTFLVAESDGVVVGTIALKDIGDGQGALRKMFVAPSHRGGGHSVAADLLETLVDHARSFGLRELYLGTAATLLAAHRFYEKSGLTRVAPDALPAAFPRMAVDTRFYRLALHSAV